MFLSVLWCFLAVSECRCLVGVENQGTSCQLDGRVGCKLSSMRESYRRTWFQNVPCFGKILVILLGGSTWEELDMLFDNSLYVDFF